MDNNEELSEFNKLLLKAKGGSQKSPYISINKLAEYMEANATRRRAIIKSLKSDSDFTKLYYQSVKSILAPYVKSSYDENIIKNAIDATNSKRITSTWKTTDRDGSIQALECLLSTSMPDLTDYEIVSNVKLVDDLILAGVKVTLKPEVYLKHLKTDKLGAIKFHLAKTESNRLNGKSRQYAATMLKYGFINSGFDANQIDANACISVDIFDESFSVSPAAYVRTMDGLTCACEEIFARWDSI